MRLIYRTLLLLFLLLPLGIAALAWFGLDQAPLVETTAPLSHQDVARAQHIIKSNDPRRLKTGDRSTLTLDEKDLNLAANYLIKKRVEGAVRIRLKPQHMNIQATTRLPLNLYLNLTLVAKEDGETIEIAGLSIGRVPVSGRLAELILSLVLEHRLHPEARQLFQEVVQALSLSEGQLQFAYEWRPELIAVAHTRLLSALDQDRLRIYHQELARLTHRPGLERRPSLMHFLQPLFQYARDRSQGDGDPVAENRALILILAAFTRGSGIDSLLPSNNDLPKPKSLTLTLERRKDFAEHFMLSAALAAAGDATLADAVGLYKELADSQGNSGFSFTDLAADRAGTRFGEMATSSMQSARRLQSLFAQDVMETDVMPKARDLPEHMNEEAFKKRFGHIDSPAYRELKQQIEQRIAACRLYRF